MNWYQNDLGLIVKPIENKYLEGIKVQYFNLKNMI